jgi:four helix bundle protein
MRSFRDLIAWQKAMDLAQEIYAITAEFPADERFGLTSQLRRCAVSVPSNIAEGHGRLTTRDLQHFLGQARGSLLELQTQVILAGRLHPGRRDSLLAAMEHADEVGRLLNGLLNSTTRRATRKSLD